jgi:hypothetical protein
MTGREHGGRAGAAGGSGGQPAGPPVLAIARGRLDEFTEATRAHRQHGGPVPDYRRLAFEMAETLETILREAGQ